MKKILNILQPLIDHLYIFQLLEYQSADLLRWFIKYPFKRNLQRKGHVEYTAHIKALLFISLFLMCLFSYLLSAGFASFFLLFIIFLQISPLFIVVAEVIFKPLEIYQRSRIVQRAITKRKKLNNLQVIAIVGSYAKTSTKNMLYTLLWKNFKVVKTPKSYNTELSIARSILSDLNQSTEVFICEMDAYHPGEIARLCQIAQPTLGIITAIGPQHLSRFGSIESLAKSQFEVGEYLASQRNSESSASASRGRKHIHSLPLKEGEAWRYSISPRGGGYLSRALFLNQHDEWSYKLAENLAKDVVFYNDQKFFIANRKEDLEGQKFDLHLDKEKTAITLPLKGEHNAVNFLAAATIAYSVGVSIKTIAKRALLIQSTEHRLEVRVHGNTTILDNTYNANPKAALASLQLLNSYKNSQKILVTPGFVELGKEHDEAHIEFAKEAAKVADEIVIIGDHAKNPLLKGLAESNFPEKQIHLVQTTAKALEHLSQIQKEGTVTVLLENDLPDQYF